MTSKESATRVAAHYVARRASSLAQVALVHGVAAAAIASFGIGLAARARRAGRPQAARWGTRFTVVIALTSTIQAVFGTVMITGAGHVDANSTRQWLIAIERLDSLKLVALGALCATGALLAARRATPRWTGGVAAAAAISLGLAATGLSGAIPSLRTAAAPALLLLLVWVAGVPAGR